MASVDVANAATFNFSFDNEDGPIDGTVEGTITLPDSDGTFPASSVVVTSAPPTLGYTLPVVVSDFPNIFLNTFTVVAGMIDTAVSSFFSQTSPSSGFNSFSLNFGPGSTLNIESSNNLLTGVQDADSSTLNISPASPASTPEPTSIITLIGAGVLGIASKKLKKNN